MVVDKKGPWGEICGAIPASSPVKSNSLQGTHGRGDPPVLGRTDCMMQSFVPGEAQGSGKPGLTSLWELSAE